MGAQAERRQESMGLILAILIAAVVLVGYVIVEKRINQRACSECGFRVSIDAPDEDCPRCGSLIAEYEEN